MSQDSQECSRTSEQRDGEQPPDEQEAEEAKQKISQDPRQRSLFPKHVQGKLPF